MPQVKVRLFCLDPSCLLRQALARGHAAIFFSATLTPMDYYRTLLGGAPEDPVLQLPSPFPTGNLAVFIQDRIQTHFKGRAESLGDVVEAIGTLVQGRRGNYLVYFPSYQYLNAVLQEFQARYPSVPVLVQRPGMTEPERDAFLAAFSVEQGETLAGFAVLGGIFGEGIDLVGERLIGAVIVGVGLPQLCVERDLIRDYFQQQNAAGFDYAYTFPGMNRVLQAIGRVIRSETDHGVVLLIDARFNELRYRRLFPAWWQSLGTNDRATAARLFHSRKRSGAAARREPANCPRLSRRQRSADCHPQLAVRHGRNGQTQKSETQHRWQTAIKDKAFDLIRHLPILETRPEHFLRVLETGKVSTNVYLRRIHNFALDMTWLPWPVIVKRQWPKVEFKDKARHHLGGTSGHRHPRTESRTQGVL
jgi:hypothetical protein